MKNVKTIRIVIGISLCSLFLCSCASLNQRKTAEAPEFFPGVRYDMEALNQEEYSAFADLIFSFVLDAVLLPVDAIRIINYERSWEG